MDLNFICDIFDIIKIGFEIMTLLMKMICALVTALLINLYNIKFL